MLAVCLFLPDAAQAANLDSGEPPTVAAGSAVVFGKTNFYDDGKHSAVAAHRSGLVLEFHKPNSLSTAIWYRIGTRNAAPYLNVTWSGSQGADISGYNPSVVISKEGYVIVASSNLSTKLGSFLYYRVGKVDPYGGHNQTIHWLTHSIQWDAGFHQSMAMNDNGEIVQVHESGTGGDGIYYRVGHLANPAGGQYQISWYGQWGNRYDTGINPAISINNRNEVVSVHQVPNEVLLHHRRGVVSGGVIQFGESRRYDNHAQSPAVALLDSGLVMEVHRLGGLISRLGRLSLTNPQEIEWFEPVKELDDDRVYRPALALSDRYAIVTFDTGDISEGYLSTPKVYCAVGELVETR
jgi:hypothetical protein